MPRKKNEIDFSERNEDMIQPESETELRKASTPRLSVSLNADGTIDWERMRPAMRDKVLSALRHGVPGQPMEVKPAFPIKREFVPVLYDSFAIILAQVGRLALKWPKELYTEIKFSAEEKTTLTEPTAKVLEKYSDKLGFLLKHQEEAALVQTLGACVKSMIERATITYVAKLNVVQTDFSVNDPAAPSPEEKLDSNGKLI